MLGSTKKTLRCASFTGAVWCSLGKRTSILCRSVLADMLPPAFRKSLQRRTSLKTLIRVASRAEMYGWSGFRAASAFGRIAARLMGVRMDSRSCVIGFRLPKAVIGSATSDGRYAFFSESTSRLCKSGQKRNRVWDFWVYLFFFNFVCLVFIFSKADCYNEFVVIHNILEAKHHGKFNLCFVGGLIKGFLSSLAHYF